MNETRTRHPRRGEGNTLYYRVTVEDPMLAQDVQRS